MPTEKTPIEKMPIENVPTEKTPIEKVPAAITPKTKFPAAINPAENSPVVRIGIPAKCTPASTRTLTMAKMIITKMAAIHHFEKSRLLIIISPDFLFIISLNIYL